MIVRLDGAKLLGSQCHRAALFVHAAHQQLAAEDVKPCPSLGHEGLLTVWSFETPYRAGRLSSVNNVSWKYT